MCISYFLFNMATILNLHKSFLNQKKDLKINKKREKPLHQGRAFDSSRFMFQQNSAPEWGEGTHFCLYNINGIWEGSAVAQQLRLQDWSMQRKFLIAHNHPAHPSHLK